MKFLGNIVSGVGVLLALYAGVAKIMNPALEEALNLGFIQISAVGGMLLAVALMVTGLVIRSWHDW